MTRPLVLTQGIKVRLPLTAEGAGDGFSLGLSFGQSGHGAGELGHLACESGHFAISLCLGFLGLDLRFGERGHNLFESDNLAVMTRQVVFCGHGL